MKERDKLVLIQAPIGVLLREELVHRRDLLLAVVGVLLEELELLLGQGFRPSRSHNWVVEVGSER